MRKLALFIFIDALGWELLKKHPFLDDVVLVKAPLESIFGYSSTCDPTIITGKMPREHGHFSFFYYNPDKSPFALCRWLSILPKSFTRRGRVRRLMSRFIKRIYGYTGYFQIYNMPFDMLTLFDYSEKRDLYEKGGINHGCPTIFDYLRDNRIPYSMSDWRAGEESNLQRLGEAIRGGEIRFAYLYMAAMDALLHAEGTASSNVAKKIAWYDAKVRDLIDLAKKHYDEVNVHIFSDHGMTDTIDTCDLIPRIEATGLKFGEDYAAVYDSTMARFWFLKPEARHTIVKALSGETRGRILSDADLANYGCDFPDRMYGDLFFLMNPGVLLCPSFMGETRLAGMHGYAPDHKDTHACYCSNRRLEPLPRRLDDLYRVMMEEISS